MSDRVPLNHEEQEARSHLITAAREMLSGDLSYIEGSAVVLRLRPHIGGIPDFDKDFMAFVAIGSATDHLPLKAQWPLWDKTALERLKPEFESAENWARSFAPDACQNLIGRFEDG
jgi:hypothetical protein